MYPISPALEFIIHSFLMRLTLFFFILFSTSAIQTKYKSSYQDFACLYFLLSYSRTNYRCISSYFQILQQYATNFIGHIVYLGQPWMKIKQRVTRLVKVNSVLDKINCGFYYVHT